MKPYLAAFVYLLPWLVVEPLFAGNVQDAKPAEVVGPCSDEPRQTAVDLDQIGRLVGKAHSADVLTVVATDGGARLRCGFQLLEGEATQAGLELRSTIAGQSNFAFRVTAAAVGRNALAKQGVVSMDGQTVRFSRPGLVEEYSVSVDGVRQDFVVLEKPCGSNAAAIDIGGRHVQLTDGELRVELSVSGARVEQTAHGAQLLLNGSGRKIAYSRLRVTDATGRDLSARMEISDTSASQNPDPGTRIAIVVNDADAEYPIRIDPTFSDANWISLGGIRGANNVVNAATADSVGNVYIGGDFTAVGDKAASRVAKWDGTNWSTLGGGVDGTVYSLAVAGSDLYVGGIFRSATNSGGVAVPVSYIAKWSGTNWSSPGLGMNFYVYALAASGTHVYAGGNFSRATNSGGVFVPANRIARWDGTNWSAMGALGAGINNDVWALAASGSDVYAGGTFTVATNSGGGTVTVNRIAKWNGTTWSALGGGISGQVLAVAVVGSDLYAGGSFLAATNTGGVTVTARSIAKWNGTSWSAVGGGVNGLVNALSTLGSELYVGGNFTVATNSGGAAVAASRVAKWSGSSWSALGSGIDANVAAVVAVGSEVYVGGFFTTLSGGGITALRIARWNGSRWSVPAAGMDGFVYSLEVSGNELYAGGQFTMAGEVPASRIARWNGSNWSALGGGMDNNVSALKMMGSDLYAGGSFTAVTNPGGATVPASRIAKWDGTNWSALLGGFNSSVSDLEVIGSDLYAGGSFTIATNTGGVPVAVNRIARWDGASWNALGEGLNSSVEAVAGSVSNVYVGGSFTVATDSGGAGVSAQNIARWDGSNWTALGGGLNASVNGLAVAGSNVYAGGNFIRATNTGGASVTVNRIARWNGSVWSALGRGMNNSPAAVAVSGGDVYAGGSFTQVSNTVGGPVSANYVARWDGTNWSSLGSGVNNFVFDLIAAGNDVFVGGAFTFAGGKVSGYAAKLVLNLEPPGFNQIIPELLGDGRVRLSYVGYPTNSYALDRVFSLSPPVSWNPQATNVTALDGSTIFTNTPFPNTNTFWRVRSVP